jgi:hypothetical protein
MTFTLSPFQVATAISDYAYKMVDPLLYEISVLLGKPLLGVDLVCRRKRAPRKAKTAAVPKAAA